MAARAARSTGMRTLVAVAVMLLLGGCGTEGEPAADPCAARDFAGDLYGALAKERGSFAFSPYSISVALAMTAAGARGDTRAQLRDAGICGAPTADLAARNRGIRL